MDLCDFKSSALCICHIHIKYYQRLIFSPYITEWWAINQFVHAVKNFLKGQSTQISKFCYHLLKGAVCRILTLLKHKNTIICLQTFRKHVKLTYLCIWKTMLQSVILLWKCAFRPGMSVFVMVCETCPLPVYPIVFRHPGLPVGGKHSMFNLIHRHVRSFLLVSLIWHPAHASSQRGPIFWIRTAIPSSTAGCQFYIQHL